MNDEMLKWLGAGLLVVGIAIAFVVSQTPLGWQGIDEAKSLVNPSGNLSARLFSGSLAKLASVDGKNVLLPSDASESAVAEMKKDPLFQQAIASDEAVSFYQGGAGRAVVTSYSGDRLASLAADPVVQDALAGRTSGVAGVVPLAPSDAKLLTTQTASGRQVPVLAPSDLGEDTFRQMQASSEFQAALQQSQLAPEKSIMLYQDPASQQTVAFAPGFSGSDLKSLQASQAVQQALSVQEIPSGRLVDASSTPPWLGVNPSTLPQTPGARLSLPFDPMQALSIPANSWLLPVAGSVILGLVYWLVGRVTRPSAHPAARKRRAAHVTELEVTGRAGVSKRKAMEEATRIIRLEPVFRVKVIDNVVGEEGTVTIAVENVCTQKLEGLSVFSGSSEARVGGIEPGEEKNVSFKPEVKEEENHAVVFLRFSPKVIQGRAYSRFEFNLPVERL